MTSVLRTALFAGASLFVVVPVAVGVTAPPDDSGAVSRPTASWTISIGGAVAEPSSLSADDLGALEQHKQTVTFESGDGFQTRVFEGPLLIDVLGLASPVFDDEIKNDKLGHAILVAASDGYVATVAWGEIDPDFEAKPVLLALSQDGEVLTDGPRLTAPGDGHGGRYVSAVTAISLVGPD